VKAKQWFYANKEVVSTREKCSNSFLAKFFPLGETNALWNKILSFQQLRDEAFLGDLQHIHHPCNHPRHGISLPFSILVIGEGKVVVLCQ
jgi:hypothetical protein